MKTKSILVSNFKFNPSNPTSDILQINNYFNVNFNNSSISSEIYSQNIFKKLLSEEEFETLTSNNEELLKKIISIVPYEYFSEEKLIVKNRLFAIDNSNKLYELDFKEYKFILVHTFSTIPKIINNNSLYFFDTNNCIIFDSDNIAQIETLPTITTFAQTSSNIFFSETKHPYNIYKAETFELKNLSCDLEQYENYKINFEHGIVIKIINLKDKIFALTKNAIFKYNEENNIFVKQNDLKLNILPNTIEQIDDCLYFFTTNGLYKYDGLDTEYISNILGNISKNAKSLCFNQNYYILSSDNSNFMYKFDFQKNHFIPIKFNNIKDMFVFSSEHMYDLCVCYNIENTYNIITLYQNLFSPNSQFVKFKPTLFGTPKPKQIRNIIFDFDGEFDIKIKSNLTQTEFTVTKQKYENLSIDGTVFTFEFSSNKYFKINSIFIEFCEVGE